MERATAIDRLLWEISCTDLSQSDVQQLVEALWYKTHSPEIKTEETSSIPFARFLTEFWDWDKSPYIQERKLQGRTMHKRYVARKAGTVKNYWIPFFGETKTLQSLTKKDLKKFAMSFLKSKTPRSAKAKNDVIRTGTIALSWAYHNELIAKDITTGLSFYGGDLPNIQLLSLEQAHLLFGRKWENSVSELANKLAMVTGLRAGEIQGLRQCDIGEDCLHINHSWNCADGLKVPKNGDRRIVYIPFPDIIDNLKALASKNPHTQDGTGYVFFSGVAWSPMDGKYWLRDLRRELRTLGLSKDQVAVIRFHSWRHFYTTHMRGSGQISDRLLQSSTGHKTLSMLEHYSNHQLEADVQLLKNSVQQVFNQVIQKY